MPRIQKQKTHTYQYWPAGKSNKRLASVIIDQLRSTEQYFVYSCLRNTQCFVNCTEICFFIFSWFWNALCPCRQSQEQKPQSYFLLALRLKTLFHFFDCAILEVRPQTVKAWNKSFFFISRLRNKQETSALVDTESTKYRLSSCSLNIT